jgi:hypothetical protein
LPSGKLEALRESLQDESDSKSSGIWWDGIENRSQSLLDKEQIRKRKDFSAELLRLNEERNCDLERRATFLGQQFHPLHSFGDLLPPLDETQLEQMLQDAENLALDLLEREAP